MQAMQSKEIVIVRHRCAPAQHDHPPMGMGRQTALFLLQAGMYLYRCVVRCNATTIGVCLISCMMGTAANHQHWHTTEQSRRCSGESRISLSFQQLLYNRLQQAFRSYASWSLHVLDRSVHS
jgi:hypothetical protein